MDTFKPKTSRNTILLLREIRYQRFSTTWSILTFYTNLSNMQQWKELHYIRQFMELLKGLEKNWIYICSSFLFQIILRLSEHLFKFVSTKDAWPWRMTWQIVSFYLKNATGILVEISSEFKDPRILLLDLERWID